MPEFTRWHSASRQNFYVFVLVGHRHISQIDTDTIHIFRLTAPASSQSPAVEMTRSPDQSASIKSASVTSFGYGVVSAILSPAASLLPFQEMMEPERDFAHAKVPGGGACVAAISENNLVGNTLNLIIVECCYY